MLKMAKFFDMLFNNSNGMDLHKTVEDILSNTAIDIMKAIPATEPSWLKRNWLGLVCSGAVNFLIGAFYMRKAKKTVEEGLNENRELEYDLQNFLQRGEDLRIMLDQRDNEISSLKHELQEIKKRKEEEEEERRVKEELTNIEISSLKHELQEMKKRKEEEEEERRVTEELKHSMLTKLEEMKRKAENIKTIQEKSKRDQEQLNNEISSLKEIIREQNNRLEEDKLKMEEFKKQEKKAADRERNLHDHIHLLRANVQRMTNVLHRLKNKHLEDFSRTQELLAEVENVAFDQNAEIEILQDLETEDETQKRESHKEEEEEVKEEKEEDEQKENDEENGSAHDDDQDEREDEPEENEVKEEENEVKEEENEVKEEEEEEEEVEEDALTNAAMKNGPDQILPASVLRTHIRTEPVQIRVEEGDPFKPLSVPSLFKDAVEKYKDCPAMCYKEGGQWQEITYGEYYRQVNLAAKAYIKLGLKRFRAVCIFGFNSPEWYVAHLAAIQAGGIATGLYITNGVEACTEIAEDADAQIFVVESSKEVSIIKAVEEKLNKKFVIVQYRGEADDDVYSWKDLLEIGEQESDEELEERLKQIAINQCCLLVYTSGTTGVSKGVMLNHDNITWVARTGTAKLGIKPRELRLLSYLTPAHIAALMVDLYGSLVSGGVVYFAESTVFRGNNMKLTLQDVQPTFFFSIPRGWEKFYELISLEMNAAPWIKRMIINLARSIGLKDSKMRQTGETKRPFGYGVADKIIFQKIKEELGLQQCTQFASGAGPIAPEIVEFFHSLGIILCESYGLSESTGPHTIGKSDAFRVGSCGQITDGYFTKILNPDEKGNGEILMKGRNITMGYVNKEQETMETVDSDGWLYTGDIGRKDSDNFLYVTGRIKRLIIGAGGYNIAPEPIEMKVKAKLPGVSFPVVIGDGKKFLTMILPIATEIDPYTGLPLDTLAPGTVKWCREIGSQANTIQDILDGPDENVTKAIQEAIDEVNKTARNHLYLIQKWAILPMDFSVMGGELTPTMKVRMEVVLKKYQDIIDDMYDV
ncbi:long-chain-fatty-acid--CoA ligase ACSBG2-like [Palaemon carinicauda]|uniref:long-chain-fatty-acid--CoA ligase ACSBG2-like n=1 Tax=Palaemon carinicauda TaxID=392227 RepID=UPI0035B68B12